MTPQMCQQAMDAVGSGVSASLRAVDCAATASAQAAFGHLFGSDGALLPALTILLTLYVAFFALSLIVVLVANVTWGLTGFCGTEWPKRVTTASYSTPSTSILFV